MTGGKSQSWLDVLARQTIADAENRALIGPWLPAIAVGARPPGDLSKVVAGCGATALVEALAFALGSASVGSILGPPFGRVERRPEVGGVFADEPVSYSDDGYNVPRVTVRVFSDEFCDETVAVADDGYDRCQKPRRNDDAFTGLRSR